MGRIASGRASLREYGNEQYDFTGKASWYGREFQGRKTASGEIFDMNQLSAAHRSLPFGTHLRVTNLENGKTVEVRINDRGPYAKGRVLDFSYGAAKGLGMLRKGEVLVGAVVLDGESNDRTASTRKRSDGVAGVSGNYRGHEYYESDGERAYSDQGRYSVQAGAFYSKKNADRLKQQIEGLIQGKVVIVRDKDLHKVRIENIGKNEAHRYRNTLKNENIPAVIIEATE
jgi:rare lipoprotein A